MSWQLDRKDHAVGSCREIDVARRVGKIAEAVAVSPQGSSIVVYVSSIAHEVSATTSPDSACAPFDRQPARDPTRTRSFEAALLIRIAPLFPRYSSSDQVREIAQDPREDESAR